MMGWLKRVFCSDEIKRLDKEIENRSECLKTVEKYNAWSQIKIEKEVLETLKYIKTGKRFKE